MQPIGIFDSGIGGLTVFKALKSLLPHESFIYLGDTARVPYGTKSRETVARYSIHNTLFLLEQNIKALVVACNTASAFGLEALVKNFKIPVIGVIEPGAQAAARTTKSLSVGVIGTEGTIQSKAYQEAIARVNPNISIQTQACPMLVALAEEGWVEGPVVDLVLEQYLSTFKKSASPIDTLILGCTHYPLLAPSIARFMGSEITLVDSANETAQILKKKLEESGLLSSTHSKGLDHFYSTDAPERMRDLGCQFLGQPLENVTKIDISGF